MAQIRAIEAQSLLDEIAQGAKATGSTLIEAIRAAKTALNSSSFKTGRVYVSTSGNGQSASFLIPSTLSADYTPTRVNAQMMEFVNIWNESVSGGLITNQADTDTNLAVMMADDRMQSITARQIDVSSIRFPSFGSTRA